MGSRGRHSGRSAVGRVGAARLGLALVAASVVVTAASSSEAGDTWKTPYPGVVYLFRTTDAPMHIHVLFVDLCTPGVRMRATGPSEGASGPTTSKFAKAVGAQAATNASFSEGKPPYVPYGLSIGNGVPWPGTSDTADWTGFIAFGADRVQLQPPAENIGAPLPWMTEAVGSGEQVLRDGAIPGTFYSTQCANSVRHPRTGVGLSADRHTAFLVVVDGRWTGVSKGMTCAELGGLFKDLGALDALNLDGGGSSTMVVGGTVVNHLCDGDERQLPNHLAVLASGNGPPASCVAGGGSSLRMAGDLFDDGGSTDLNGDGRADVCVRGSAGVECYLGSGTALSERIEGPALRDDGGWTDPANWATLRMGDVNGDGLADLCGRGDGGFQCWFSKGTGFGDAVGGPTLEGASGWGQASHYGSLRLSDFNGDGLDDVCGRGTEGFQCWPSTGAGFGQAVQGPLWSDATGWGAAPYAGTIRMGDVNGDGRRDVCARGVQGIECYLSDGVGFPTTLQGPAWSDAEGWDTASRWATIRLADLDGDARADLCARSDAGFLCHLSKGTGFGSPILGPPLSDADGWDQPARYGTIRLADIDGDRLLDVCARGANGVSCWRFAGDKFDTTPVPGPALTDAEGWSEDRYWQTLRLADVTGDGLADICARGADKLLCWVSEGKSILKQIDGPGWTDAAGWGSQPYYGTLRLSGPRTCTPRFETCNGVDDDCDGKVDEGCSGDGGAEPKEAGPGISDARPDSPTGNQAGSDGTGVDSGCGCRSTGMPRGAFGATIWLAALCLARRGRRLGRPQGTSRSA